MSAGTGDIAVVVTCHNYGRYLVECLESIANQRLSPARVVVVDDASEDDTAEVAGQHDVHLVRVDCGNANSARNAGFEATTSDEVVFFDADDRMTPRFLERLHAALETDSDAAFAYSDRTNFATGDVTGSPLEVGLHQAKAFNVRALRKANYISLPALIRSNRFPGFDPEVTRYQDWDLWLSIVERGGWGVYVPEALFECRIHADTLTWREGRDRAVWRIRRKHRIGALGRLPLIRDSFLLYRLMKAGRGFLRRRAGGRE